MGRMASIWQSQHKRSMPNDINMILGWLMEDIVFSKIQDLLWKRQKHVQRSRINISGHTGVIADINDRQLRCSRCRWGAFRRHHLQMDRWLIPTVGLSRCSPNPAHSFPPCAGLIDCMDGPAWTSRTYQSRIFFEVDINKCEGRVLDIFWSYLCRMLFYLLFKYSLFFPADCCLY